MRVLLDTHTFVWWDSAPARLSPRAMSLLTDPGTTALLSVASVWELVIKAQLGKVTLRLPLRQIISHQVANGIALLPVSLNHVLGVETLPLVHKDPFDRLLAAQAIAESLPLVTADPVFAGYPVRVEW